MDQSVLLWMFGVVATAIIGNFAYSFVVNNRIDVTNTKIDTIHETDTDRAKTLATEFSDKAKTLATELSDFKTRSSHDVRQVEENLCAYKVLGAEKFVTLENFKNINDKLDRLIEGRYGK